MMAISLLFWTVNSTTARNLGVLNPVWKPREHRRYDYMLFFTNLLCSLHLDRF